MKYLFYIVIAFLFLTGCSTLKQEWKNFNAYYNTFYNTKQFFNEGVKKNKRQIPDISPQQFVHIYPSPTAAGREDFDEAISRGSSILRNHEDSKYVLPAIAIIGKSYYYKGEYFSALEKFQELQILADGNLEQEAVFWQGLTYIELNIFREGANVLETELEVVENWNKAKQASVYAVLGQLYAYTEDFELSVDYLNRAIGSINSQEIKARIFFLQGQVLEILERDTQALFAYDRSGDLSTDFDLEFNALRKEAEVSRRIGSYTRSEYIFDLMSRDDKFLEYRSELKYEIARTSQLGGDTENAIEEFNNVLRNQVQPATALTKAKTYHALGEIYRDRKNDYITAAAYFDSASTQRVDRELLPKTFNASEMADLLGRYASYKNEIAERDSLLHLAEMDQEELNTFITELQIQEAQKLQDELEELQSERNRMIVAESPDSVIESTETLEHGFLNSNNPALLADASLQFQAIWGDRGLQDNWRRRSEVNTSRFDRPAVSENGGQLATDGIPEEAQTSGIVPQIDLSDVPFDEEDRERVYREIEEYQYRLANLFFLNLDQADSAKVYFQKVLDSSYDKQLTGMSIYAIAEIELLNDNIDEAHRLLDKLRSINPNSALTNRLADRLDVPLAGFGKQEQDTFIDHELISSSEADPENARRFIRAAESIENSNQRALLLFEAAREYMKIARIQTTNESILRNWFEKKQEVENLKDDFSSLKDSSRVMLADTTLSESDKAFWQQIADSTFMGMDLSGIFPFEGAYWDSTRTLLASISSEFPSSPVKPRAERLLSELTPPVPSTEVQDTTTVAEETRQEDEIKQPIGNESCGDVGVFLNYEGGIDAFMKTVQFPSWTESLSMRGEVIYLFTISPEGELLEYEQVSSMDRSGIPQAIEQVLDDEIQFNTTQFETNIECRFTFPINL